MLTDEAFHADTCSILTSRAFIWPTRVSHDKSGEAKFELQEEEIW